MLKVSNACNNAKISKQKKNQHEFKSIIGKLNAVSQHTQIQKQKMKNTRNLIFTGISALQFRQYTISLITQQISQLMR